jgi:periplasmic copper chaperone A
MKTLESPTTNRLELTMMNLIKQFFKLLTLTFLLSACEANHGVAVLDAWARANAPGQTVGAAYMTLLSAQDSSLIKIETAVADVVEIHSMSMDNGVMKMRMLETLPLSADKPEKLAPGGFHLMLFDLKKPLTSGATLDLKLTFKDKAGNITQQNVTLPIKADE